MIKTSSKLIPWILWLIGSSAMAAETDPTEPGLSDYTTCAVYFRMVVGSMSGRYGRDLGPLADIEREKMDRAMELAKAKAAEEHGEELAEEVFQEEWRIILGEMTDAINRNYENISRLRLRYDNFCESLIERAPAESE